MYTLMDVTLLGLARNHEVDILPVMSLLPHKWAIDYVVFDT